MVQTTNWKKKYLKYKLKLEKIQGGTSLHKSLYIFQKIINRNIPQLVFISSGCSMPNVQNCRGDPPGLNDETWETSPNSISYMEHILWRRARNCSTIKDNYEDRLRSLYGGLFIHKINNEYVISDEVFDNVCGQQCPYPIMKLSKVMPELLIEIILIDPNFYTNPVPSFLPPWFIPETRPGYTPENYFYENKVISYTFRNMRVSVIAEGDYRFNDRNNYEIFKDSNININNIGEIVAQNGGILIDRGGSWNGIGNIWDKDLTKTKISDVHLNTWGILENKFLEFIEKNPRILKIAEEKFNSLDPKNHERILKGTNYFLEDKFRKHFQIDEL
jgi:hypothetical protein